MTSMRKFRLADLIAHFEHSNNLSEKVFGFINFFPSISKTIVLQLSHSACTTITARLQVLCRVWLGSHFTVI